MLWSAETSIDPFCFQARCHRKQRNLTSVFYRQHCAQRKPAGISFTQRPILRFFAPQGRHVAPMGVQFGMEEGTEGPLLHAIFHPHRCNNKGVGPPKLKFLLRFDRNLEYKRPAGAYPSRDFHKICRVCASFQDVLGVKFWSDLLKGLWSYGGFKLRGSGFPQIFSAP